MLQTDYLELEHQVEQERHHKGERDERGDDDHPSLYGEAAVGVVLTATVVLVECRRLRALRVPVNSEVATPLPEVLFTPGGRLSACSVAPHLVPDRAKSPL